MDKRYQVFVSSTYADLKDERQKVMQTLMEMDCFPAGMELFPAADEDQFEFIKKVIDDCDYYLLIIGGRYGTLTSSGISYTEQEYDYAVGRGLKVVALLHDSPDQIALGKSEKDPELRKRLDAFRAKAANGRLVRTWNSANELPGLVSLSLSKTIKTHPARGWVRADAIASEQVLSELNEVRKANIQLAHDLAQAQTVPAPQIPDLAGLDEAIRFHGKYWTRGSSNNRWSATLTWRRIFGAIAPYLVGRPTSERVKDVLENAAFAESGEFGSSPEMNEQEFQTVSVQLQALGLVKVEYLSTTAGGMGLFWEATPGGDRLMLEVRAIRSAVAGA